jgi:hypothetical protein
MMPPRDATEVLVHRYARWLVRMGYLEQMPGGVQPLWLPEGTPRVSDADGLPPRWGLFESVAPNRHVLTVPGGWMLAEEASIPDSPHRWLGFRDVHPTLGDLAHDTFATYATFTHFDPLETFAGFAAMFNRITGTPTEPEAENMLISLGAVPTIPVEAHTLTVSALRQRNRQSGTSQVVGPNPSNTAASPSASMNA